MRELSLWLRGLEAELSRGRASPEDQRAPGKTKMQGALVQNYWEVKAVAAEHSPRWRVFLSKGPRVTASSLGPAWGPRLFMKGITALWFCWENLDPEADTEDGSWESPYQGKTQPLASPRISARSLSCWWAGVGPADSAWGRVCWLEGHKQRNTVKLRASLEIFVALTIHKESRTQKNDRMCPHHAGR